MGDLHQLLAYDPITGIFTWKVDRKSGIARIIKAGSRAGSKNYCGHRLIGVDRIKYREHRLAYEWTHGPIPAGFEIDHVNGVYGDNRIANLRLATHQQNIANCKNRKNNTSGRKGVHRHSDGRWRARITVNSKGIHLGCFDSVDEAHGAYMIAARKYFGEFARAS